MTNEQARPARADVGGVAAELHRRDPSADAFGIELVEAGPGRAMVEMRVERWMCNGLGTCHGGVVFTLADSAMAFASNGHGEAAFAVAASVDLLVPAHADSTLRATAVEQWMGGRTGIYDAVVTAHDDPEQDPTTVAMFRGRVRRVGRPVFDSAHDTPSGDQGRPT